MNNYIFMYSNDGGFSVGLGFWGHIKLLLKSGFNFLLLYFIIAG